MVPYVATKLLTGKLYFLCFKDPDPVSICRPAKPSSYQSLSVNVTGRERELTRRLASTASVEFFGLVEARID